MVAISDNDELTTGLKVFDETENEAWEIEDRYGKVLATRIPDVNGEYSGWDMVHMFDTDEGRWYPTRAVSEGYRPTPTGAVVDRVRELLENDVLDEQFDEQGSKHRIRLALDCEPIEIAKTAKDSAFFSPPDAHHIIRPDIWTPMVEISNSYDGVSSVMFAMGLYRMICTNGLIVQAFNGSTFRTKRVHRRLSIAAFAGEVEQFSWQLDSFYDHLRKMNEIKPTKEQLEELMQSVSKKWHERIATRTEVGGGTTYALLNAITDIQSHDVSVGRAGVFDSAIEQVLQMAA